MPRALPKDPILTALPKACSDELAAVEFFEAMRWADGAACPRCGDVDVYQMQDSNSNKRQANYRWRCRGCKKQFTVRVGTILEDSAVPLQAWAFAFWQACAGKKGVAAKQIERQCGVSYKTALFMLHRIRWAMVDNGGEPLVGTVEVDETYVGGKPRKGDGIAHKRGRGTRKQPVVAMVERNTPERKGRVRTRVVANVTASTLRSAMVDNICPTTNIRTDELSVYPAACAGFASHEAVKHGAGEYVNGDAHTNNAESFFSRFKRSVFGIHHKISKEHLHRYATHMEFLHNSRDLTDGERVHLAIRMADGKRLTRHQPA